MLLRELELEDYKKGFVECLKELTEVGDISEEAFLKRYNKIKYKEIYIIVAEENNVVVGAGTVFFEPKFIRNLGTKAYIEDIVVRGKYRGRGIGKKIIEKLVEYAKSNNVYKIVLCCDENKVKFYEKCGFERKGVEMVMYRVDK
ncbi:Glucosamine 6-phosphate N-acetyltransferase [Spraguea lophii 42_110]|uniref:Glucosamine 6-phosphate N-acetyltransferase n=1 Tax=Spraguea lophii (strain 42_110) TaxID=1358809 RepID=S7W7G4_SPRLO|nr:Glucosamine 6-phosphate N-acetyltransferase [Spraguea lophii 42_110]